MEVTEVIDGGTVDSVIVRRDMEVTDIIDGDTVDRVSWREETCR